MKKEPSDNLKINDYKKSIQRLEAIYKDIALTVTEVSKWRCPYKNAQDFCTAKFRCRNQYPADSGIEKQEIHFMYSFTCIGSDKLDYRNAWEIE